MKARFTLVAIALSTLFAGTVAIASEETYVPPAVSTLSRAEVKADLAAWSAAGLADEARGEETPDIYSARYRAKFAIYQHTRQAAMNSAPHP